MLTQPSSSLYEQSQKLLRQYQDYPDHQLRNQLVQIHIGLVRQEAYRWLGRCHESSDELVQVGSIGLIRAIERFDLNQGYAFSSFAVPYIRGEIQHYLRDRSLTMRIPRRWQTLETRSTGVVRRLQQQLERFPRDHEIAAALGVSPGEWQEVKLARQNRHLISLDAPLPGEDSISLMESLPDPRYKSFQLAQEDKIRLQHAMEQLERRTREILEFVFLYDLTQKETADRLGISVVTVSRRVKQGLQHLKSLMTHGGG